MTYQRSFNSMTLLNLEFHCPNYCNNYLKKIKNKKKREEGLEPRGHDQLKQRPKWPNTTIFGNF